MSSNDTTESGTERADLFFNEHLEGQRDWYDNKATSYKKWHKQLGFVILAAGALIAVIPIWTPPPPPPDPDLHQTTIVISLLGTLVVLTKGVERIWNFDENWSNYRQACEAMKRERRLYINTAGFYTNINNENTAYRLFVERIEDIVQAEQHTFWSVNNSKPADDSEPTPSDESNE